MAWDLLPLALVCLFFTRVMFFYSRRVNVNLTALSIFFLKILVTDDTDMLFLS